MSLVVSFMTDLGKQAKWVEPGNPQTTERLRSKTNQKRKRNRNDYIQHRQRLYHVYGSVCWLCGKPNAAQIDHVIPLSQGGSNDFTNLRLAHDECNVARNRQNHPWHRAPALTAKGFPRLWNGMRLVKEMWDEEFVARRRASQGSKENQSPKMPLQETDLGRQARWVDPRVVDLGEQARWVDPGTNT